MEQESASYSFTAQPLEVEQQTIPLPNFSATSELPGAGASAAPPKPPFKRKLTRIMAVANLCPTETSNLPENTKTPLPLTILRQALIVVFKEAFPLARSQHKGSPQSLDASYIQLDSAYLRRADLKQVWLPDASLRGADLSEADLSGAKLCRADLSGTNLSGANLKEADLYAAILDGTLLKDTNLCRTKGLTREQLEACKAKGAIIDEDPMTSSSQSAAPPLAPLSPSHSNDA